MIVAAWECPLCESSGRDPEPVVCFFCGNPDVKTTARVEDTSSLPPDYGA